MQILSRGLPDKIDVIFDPRCASAGYDRYLRLVVNLAFTVQLEPYITKQISASLVGDHRYPWSVREAQAQDTPGLLLADWLSYPRYALHRAEPNSERRKVYERIVKSLIESGVDHPVNFYARRGFVPKPKLGGTGDGSGRGAQVKP